MADSEDEILLQPSSSSEAESPAITQRKFHSASGRRQHTPLRFRFGFGWRKNQSHSAPLVADEDQSRNHAHQHNHTHPRHNLLSLFYVHNETGNFYTHAFGAFFFVILQLCTRYFLLAPNKADWTDYLVLPVSTPVLLFHLFCCHSQKVQRTCMKCDYVGIVVLIVGSMLASMWYGFHCHPTMAFVYMGMIGIAGVVTVGVNSSEYFAGPKYRSLRTLLFILIPTLIVIPAIHSILALDEDWDTLMRMISMPYFVLMIECLYPGYFDYWFQSHQIFHVFVILGAVFHHMGLTASFLWRKGDGVCPSGTF
ncbi:HlyIII-domain-containing protein [Rhizoclosmatium globosum]|uniref:HlyIII-domain-containing protein n=1 Tax=Rhizoclosmatium globosum TaxID=329046 RepID=A0A1Y2D0B0_9FUNG|nr:HlyIII-domain-containing protein [Rhizoclosmatium globosum]|eukprot:ORY52566.1 HlyIII-domain-containing protein [Rhizoclosmatium globosum]